MAKSSMLRALADLLVTPYRFLRDVWDVGYWCLRSEAMMDETEEADEAWTPHARQCADERELRPLTGRRVSSLDSEFELEVPD